MSEGAGGAWWQKIVGLWEEEFIEEPLLGSEDLRRAPEGLPLRERGFGVRWGAGSKREGCHGEGGGEELMGDTVE